MCGQLDLVYLPGTQQLVEDVVASEQRGYVSVTLLFGCSMRYRSHTPATDGETLQVRRHPGGAVSHLEIATFVFTREPSS